MWQVPGRELGVDGDDDADGRERRIEVDPKLPRSEVLHCSPVHLNRGPPENQWTLQPGKRGTEGRGSGVFKKKWG